MSDKVEEENKAPSTMAETEEPQDKPNVSFSIWPPTQRTRDAVINSMIQNLSSSTVFSKRFGTIPEDEASVAARIIENEAFSASPASAASDDDGIRLLQVYSKEISKRMLDLVKSRSASASNSPEDGEPPVSTTISEENLSAQTESN